MSARQITDKELFAAIKEDDYISYNKFFDRYYIRLCQYVYSIIKDKDDSEDIVQELFLSVWSNRKKLAVEDNIPGYLYVMSKNLTLNYIRSKANYKNLLKNQEEKPEYYEEYPMETDEFRIALFDCINLLPARSREILILHRIKGYKQKEIAERLDITVKTIKNQIWTSLQKLRLCLEEKKAWK